MKRHAVVLVYTSDHCKSVLIFIIIIIIIEILQLWDAELVEQISCHRYVQRVIAIGTLFALELRADGGDAG